MHKAGVLQYVSKYNLFHSLLENVVLVMKYDCDSLEAMSDIPAPPDAMMVDMNDKPSVDVAKTRALVGFEGVQLLVNNTERVSIAQVVDRLVENSRYQHLYLDALWLKDQSEASSFHALQVELYAQFDPSRLLHFLKTSNSYSVQSAYAVCEARDLVYEQMYLLGKMGNNRKALYLIIERL
jgi:hypothetical protein